MVKNSPDKPDKALLKQLAIACWQGDAAVVKKLLEAEPKLATAWKPIMDASFQGQAEVIRLLLKHGADPNVEGTTGHHYRPLHRVIEPKITDPRGPRHEEAVKALLAGGADPALRGTVDDVTALGLAATGAPRFVPLLVERLRPLDIWHAAACLDDKRAAALLKKTPALVQARDPSGRTALHYCAASALFGERGGAQLRLAELLLDAGADVNATFAWRGDEKGWPISVLYFACGKHDNAALTELLLKRGANMYDNESVYHASDEGHAACLSVLERYAEPRKLAAEATMCLRVQLHWGRSRGLAWLLGHGADPDVPDEKTGNTALHEAAKQGSNEKVIAALLDHGASPKRRNDASLTPIDIARKAGNRRVVEQLEGFTPRDQGRKEGAGRRAPSRGSPEATP